MVEIEKATVFEKAIDYADHSDVLAEFWDSGLQATSSADIKIDFDTGNRCLVESFE